MKWIAGLVLGVPLLLLLALAMALWLGGPGEPPTLQGLAQAFRAVDYSTVPAVSRFSARDGTQLAFRRYNAAPGANPTPTAGSVVLVHGSSATSRSMHPMALALASAGYTVYALDLRGHGDSGPRGRIDHVGQLEEDLADFTARVQPATPRILAGFSSGGGFALRFASGPASRDFDGYLLLSPFLHQNSPAQRPGSGGWASIGVPRLIAQDVLTRLGVTAFNHLPVTRFAIDPANAELLTASYDYNLSTNFRPRSDYRGDIAAATQPVIVLAGSRDEAFDATTFAAIFAACPGLRRVRILPDVDHAGLVLRADALAEALAAVRLLNVGGAN